MEFKVGMQIHDLQAREWYTIAKVENNKVICFGPYGSMRRMSIDYLEREIKQKVIEVKEA